jgi:hypothetical protein
MALLNRGICLDAVGDHDAALAVYDELIATFGDADDPVTRDQVVRGRVNRPRRCWRSTGPARPSPWPTSW